MNTLLWALQVILAVKFGSVAYSHGLRTDQAKMQQGIQRLGAVARPLLTLIALCTFLGGVGLILPGATGILTWLTPLSAAILALMMLLSVGFHLRCRESPNLVPGFVILALATFLAYGRWVIVPF
ncbi:MAG: DoxX family protein [Anaerolineae bacterium]|nr:DoxX family protein [Anaerolineae bacterium]